MERRVRRRLTGSDPNHSENLNLVGKRQAETSQSSQSVQAGLVSTLGNGTRISLVIGYSTELTYSVPIQLGDESFNVQVDTGSGDLWVANKDCKSSACNPNSGSSVPKWDQEPSIPTNKDFTIDYLIGSASGKIVTTDVKIGNSVNQNQALGSISQVTNEALSTGNFSGVLGLSLPSNSIIANLSYTSPPDTSNLNPENGQNNPSLTGSILAGLWNSMDSSKIGKRFFGLGLQRLPSDGGVGDSVITFGAQDPNYVPDEGKIKYQPVVPGRDGIQRHWNAYISDIIVGFNGTQTHISPGSSSVAANSLTPVAVLDSGAGLSYGPPEVLNAVYGAFGVGPASDGSGGYYMSCDLQMNITLGVGGVLVPIHPLDASLVTYNSADGSKTCLGSFQALPEPTNGQVLPADWVLSAPFLRNVWTVFSCDSILGENTLANASAACNPTIGLYPTTTNATLAADQFHRVRVLGEQLGDDNQVNNRFSNQGGGLSAGVKAAIGLVCGLVGIVAIMILAFYLLKRRRMKLAGADDKSVRGKGVDDKDGRESQLGEDAFLTAGMTPREEEFSENQAEKTRQLNLIHGIFEDDIHNPSGDYNRYSSSNRGNKIGTDTVLSTDSVDWQTGSTPYIDAKKVKHEYVKRHPSLDRIRNDSNRNSSSNTSDKEASINTEENGAENDFVEDQEAGSTPLRNLTRESHQNPRAL